MNKNNAYAYLLLGAVVLAGLGGFMMADNSLGSPDIPIGVTSHATDMVINIIDSEPDTEATTNGEAS